MFNSSKYEASSGISSYEDIVSSPKIPYVIDSSSKEEVKKSSSSEKAAKNKNKAPENNSKNVLIPQNKISNYYYTCLTEKQKFIYKRIDEAFTQLSDSAVIDFSVSQEDIYLAFYAYRFDNPQKFYIPSDYAYVTSQKGTKVTTELKFKYPYTKSEIADINNKLDAYVNRAFSNVSVSMTDFEREEVLHDFINNNTVYSKETEKFEIYTVAGIINGSAVCEGYAKMLKLLLDKAGINSLIVTGYGSSDGSEVPHSWNLALINGQYYNVDATFDDTSLSQNGEPLYIENKDTSKPKKQLNNYRYFNLSDEEIKSTHRRSAPEQNYENIWFKTPPCQSTEMNYYKVTGSNTAISDIEIFLDKKLKEAKASGYYYFYINCDNLTFEDFENYILKGCRANGIKLNSPYPFTIYAYEEDSLPFSKGCVVVL